MKRTVRQKEINFKPVKKIELSENNIKLRTVAVVAMILIAATAFGFGIYHFVTGQPQWITVKYIMSEANCSGDFYFQYNVSGKSEEKEVEALYSTVCNDLYKTFSKDTEFADINNICSINRSPNKVCTVPHLLYDSLQKVADQYSGYLYLGPLYTELEALCLSENDMEASQFDPARDQEAKEYFDTICKFISSGKDIELRFLGEDQVELVVSQEYLDFSKSMGDIDFVGLGWMQNAFVIDNIADRMIEAGFTEGCISSYDGFIRCLDPSPNEYAVDLYKRNGEDIVFDRKLSYRGQTAFVIYRDYPLTDPDVIHYYTYSDGTVITPYLDKNGQSPSVHPNTVCCYSSHKDCQELLLNTLHIYMENDVSVHTNDITVLISD